MSASSPLRTLALIGAVALVVLAALGWRAGTVEAGSRGLRLAPARVAADTDTARVVLPPLSDSPFDASPDSGFADGLAADTLVADTLVADSVRADTVDQDSTERARRYLPGTPYDNPFALRSAVRARRLRTAPLRGAFGNYLQRDATLDTVAYRYTVRESIASQGGQATELGVPAELSLQEFLLARRAESLDDGFRSLAANRTRRTGPGGVGITFDIPGGEQSAFRTIFGKNEVDLRVNGTSNVNLGLSYDQNERRQAFTGQEGILAPDFGQELNLTVKGTIGDKLAINVNYDTQSQFDFENQVSLVYSGYEDDIVQRVEAGNVFLNTPTQLIRGGQRLFGIRTDLQLGPLALAAVASQQDAETSEVVIDGGSQATAFDLAPYDYEDDTNYFLGYAFHNWWDRGHRQPGGRTAPPGFRELIDIEVWKYDPSVTNNTESQDETTYAVALADLGEPRDVLLGGEAYLALQQSSTDLAPLPDSTRHQYTEADLEEIRQNSSQIDFESRFGLEIGTSYSTNQFKKLRRDIDYTVDPILGWVSLTTSLNESDVLAVAYQYRRTDDQVVTVGDFASATQSNTPSGPRSLLKLLRVNGQTPSSPLWDLTMRNIYRIGGRSLNATSFDLALTYEAAGETAQPFLPDVSIGTSRLTALEAFGLDRTNEQGAAISDERFDFIPGVTIDPAGGRVIFPVRQPFGDFLETLLTEGVLVSGEEVLVTPEGTTIDELVARFIPLSGGENLYDLRRTQARQRLTSLARFSIGGTFKSATQSVFDVGFNLVEGTVRVTSGEQELVEGSDFRVNTSAGTVEITNPLYLQSGQQVRIQVEKNQFFSIGSKTLLGLRADYRLSDEASLGGTWMKLSERPLTDKFRVGEEALSNTVVGLDGLYETEPRWMTRLVDALPLIQTRALSRFRIEGEVARLSPDHPETFAFEQTRRGLQADGFDLAPDELSGISYVDDFEGSENAFTGLGQPSGWRLAAPPDSSGPAVTIPASQADRITDPRLRGNWRGTMAWYTLNERNYNDYNDDGLLTRAAAPVTAQQLYDREFRNAAEARRPLSLLDVYFDPTRRGPYNYNEALDSEVAENPRAVWGAMVQGLSGSYSDFEGQNNIEYIEVLMQPLGGRSGSEPIAPGAVMYLDLGRINEDILPNGVLNAEDGIRDGGTPGDDLDRWGRVPSVQTNGVVDLFSESGRTEDLGLDGLPSSVQDIVPGGEPYELDELTFFSGGVPLAGGGTSADFLGTLTPGTVEFARAARDPSADDYHHFEDDAFFGDAALFPGGASVQERYTQYLSAVELNSAQAQREIARSGSPGISTLPNTEDINNNSTVDGLDAFHRYAIPLDEVGLAQSPFLQNTIPVASNAVTGDPDTWYLLRIPVRTDNRTTSRGLDRDDFSRIEAVRLWTTGHDKPATLRIASFELVGSQWLQSEQVGAPERDERPSNGPLPLANLPEVFIESVNNEESPQTYAIPNTAVVNTARDLSGAVVRTREQAIVVRTEDLAEGYGGAITRSYATRPLDLTKYSNLRMFTHGDGFERRDSVRVFIRLGDDETENYYEYSQPLVPFDPARAPELSGPARADSLWQMRVPIGGGETRDLNSVNVVLSALNQLKVARDNAGVSVEETFRSTTTPEGAPPGARIAVRGQPSIQDVKVIVLGVRNAEGGQIAALDTATVWFNELRVSGYDEQQAAAGFLSANVALADLATINARFSFTDDGFGDLGSGLGERIFSDQTTFSLQSTVNAHKLLPERFGWNIPVSVSVTQNASTPRFDPDRGDILLEDLAEQARTDSTLTDGAIRAEEIIERAQTVTSARTVRVPISKSGSRSPWLRYSIDALNLAYSNTAQRNRSPSNVSADLDSWRADLGYRVNVPNPKTVAPLWLLRPVPVLGAIGDLRLNLLPRTLSLTTDLGRSISATLPRLRTGLDTEPDSLRDFIVRQRRTQSFAHGRQIDMQYDPFSFLQLSYGSDVSQDLGAAGQNEAFSIFVRERIDPDDPDAPVVGRRYNLSPAEASAPDSPVRADFGLGPNDSFNQFLEILGGPNLEVLPLGNAVDRIFRGGFVRTQDYQQTANASLRISTQKVKWLSWIRPQALSYGTNYAWQDVFVTGNDDVDVAAARTRAQMQAGLQFRPREFWRLFPFYRALEGRGGAQPARGAQGRGASRGVRGRPTPAADSSAAPRAGGGNLLTNVLKGGFLAVTGVDDLTLTYRGSLTNEAEGIEGGAYSLISGLRGTAPSLGYRLGIDRSLPLESRLNDPVDGFQFDDSFGEQHDLQARTQLEPFKGLRVGLNWQTGWSETERVPFGFDEAGELVRLQSDERGGGESTVLSVGASYNTFLERQVARLADDREAAETNGAGQLVSGFRSRNGLATDFVEEFGRGPGRYGPEALLSLPSPGWDVTYSGLSSWPLFKRIANQVTLRHGYLATSAASYLSVIRTTPALTPIVLGEQPITLVAPDANVEASTMTVNERFQPLVGAAIGWKAGFQTDLTWNRSNLYTLQTNTAQFVEKRVQDVQLQFSFAKNGIKIPLFRRLNNNIRLTVTASVSDDQTFTRNIQSDLTADLRGIDRITPGIASIRRISVWPRLSYSLSNRVTTDVFVRYERSEPEGTQSFPTSTFDGGVSFRISFSN